MGERIRRLHWFFLLFHASVVVVVVVACQRRPLLPLTLGLNLDAWRPVPEGRASSFETSMNDILRLSLSRGDAAAE